MTGVDSVGDIVRYERPSGRRSAPTELPEAQAKRLLSTVNRELAGIRISVELCDKSEWPTHPSRFGDLPDNSMLLGIDLDGYRTFVALPDSPDLDVRRAASVVREWAELAAMFDHTDLGALVVARAHGDMRPVPGGRNEPLAAFTHPVNNVVYLNPAYVLRSHADAWERHDRVSEARGEFAQTFRLKVLGVVSHEAFHLVHRQLESTSPSSSAWFTQQLGDRFFGEGTDLNAVWIDDGAPAPDSDRRFATVRHNVSTYATVGLAELAAELFRGWRGEGLRADKTWFGTVLDQIRS